MVLHANASPPATASRWLNRWSIVLVCLTWPLIWIGGLVTTYDAGMAVPDWPNTYGYNMFLYPLSTWLYGPFDLLIEHGHRLLASLVGLLTLVMLVIAIRTESRRWVIRLCVVTAIGVMVQGALGGMRVVFDARTIAMIHGCVGPAFFVLCWVVAGVTSQWWQTGAVKPADNKSPNGLIPGFAQRALLISLLAYGQLVVGAQLRHMPVDASRSFFSGIVGLHIILATAIAALVAVLAWRSRRCGDLTLSRIVVLLLILVAVQWSLGFGTWIVNYGFPLDRWPALATYVIMAKGWHESIIVTSHVATGSLILALSAFLTLRAARRFGGLQFYPWFPHKRLST